MGIHESTEYYVESAQYQSLRRKLQDAGCSLRTLDQERMGQGMIERLLIFRGNKPPIGAVILDMGKDGYGLYLATAGSTIDSDIEAIKAAS